MAAMMSTDTSLRPQHPDCVLLPEVHIERLPENTPPECKLTSEEPKLSKEDSQETRHLKELLLLHLDLIQEQQESLLAKDRSIKCLRQEKEALKCRLERMERRLSILRHKGGDDVSPSRPAAQPVTSLSASPAPAIKQEIIRGIKRRNTLEPLSLSKRFAAVSKSDQPGIGRKDRFSSNRMAREQCKADSSPVPMVKRQSRRTISSCSSSASTVPEKDSESVCSSSAGSKRKPRNLNHKASMCKNNILRTDCMYYVPIHPAHEPGDISPVKEKKEEEEVTVPSFRVKAIPTGYSMEGTENLNDEIYLRRHQKPEAEEKRRKRWDFQRLREEKIVEKLQQGRYYRNENNNKKEPDLETLLPDQDRALFIEVCDEVPVSAFGVPIPEIKPQEFTLPWFDPVSKKEEPKKRTRRL